MTLLLRRSAVPSTGRPPAADRRDPYVARTRRLHRSPTACRRCSLASAGRRQRQTVPAVAYHPRCNTAFESVLFAASRDGRPAPDARGTGAGRAADRLPSRHAVFEPARTCTTSTIAREVRIETHRGRDASGPPSSGSSSTTASSSSAPSAARSGRWYQEALGRPDVTLDDSGRRLEARAVPVHDAGLDPSRQRGAQAQVRGRATGLDVDAHPGGARRHVPPRPTLRGRGSRSRRLPTSARTSRRSSDRPSRSACSTAAPAIEENVILQPQKPV